MLIGRAIESVASERRVFSRNDDLATAQSSRPPGSGYWYRYVPIIACRNLAKPLHSSANQLIRTNWFPSLPVEVPTDTTIVGVMDEVRSC